MQRLGSRTFLLILVSGLLLFHMQGGASEGGESTFYPGLLALVLIMVSAKLGGEAFERMNQPAVLGELVVGMFLGGLGLAGVPFLDEIAGIEALRFVAEIGVVLLLFEVGLESHLGELVKVGPSALAVALLGVAAPVVLGYFLTAWLMPERGWNVHLFVGCTLAATSVGITARVLQDLKKIETDEARIILGAAVVDDVLGLILLAVISGIVTRAGEGGDAAIDVGVVAWIVAKALLFLVGAVFIGRQLHLGAVRAGARFRVPGVPVVVAIAFCFLMAGLAGLIGLAPIVGAFAAGLVLEPSDYEVYRERGEHPIEELVRPLAALFTPVFFVMMGLQVNLRAFTSVDVLAFAAAVTLVAILSKQLCSLGVLQNNVSRVIVGIGMIPRGEVGLIFANEGANLGVFPPDLVSAMVVMVIVTTLVTPPVLKQMLVRQETTSRG